jgi:NAD(P)-dependent dehydrogenase (short-subunit alcohol dehydrogenase family)
MKGVDCMIKRDLRGRIAIVTGGNTGIGRETVIGLIENGCEVVIAARDQVKSQKVIEDIYQLFPNAHIHAMYLNLSSKK